MKLRDKIFTILMWPLIYPVWVMVQEDIKRQDRSYKEFKKNMNRYKGEKARNCRALI